MGNYTKAGVLTTTALLGAGVLHTGCTDNKPLPTDAEKLEQVKLMQAELLLEVIKKMADKKEFQEGAARLTGDEFFELDGVHRATLTRISLESHLAQSELIKRNASEEEMQNSKQEFDQKYAEEFNHWSNCILVRLYLDNKERIDPITDPKDISQAYREIMAARQPSVEYFSKEQKLIQDDAERRFKNGETIVPDFLPDSNPPAPTQSPAPAFGGKKASLNIMPRESWSTGDPNIATTTTAVERAAASRETGETVRWV